MKRSTIYRKAARLVSTSREWAGHTYSCTAVDTAAGGYMSSPRQYYSEMMSPEGGRELRVNDFDPDDGIISFEDARNHRVIALCFMAAIAEDEEKS